MKGTAMRSTSVHSRLDKTIHKSQESRPKRQVRLSFQVTGFKPQPDPYWDEPRSFRMRAACSALPRELIEWDQVNLREQKLGGPVTKAVTETWDEYPTEFHRCSRGALLFGRDLSYEKVKDDKGTLTLTFRDPKLDGTGD